MSSRRLAISSLLCDDDERRPESRQSRSDEIVPEPVVLAPHLRSQRNPATADHVQSQKEQRQFTRDNEHIRQPVDPDYGYQYSQSYHPFQSRPSSSRSVESSRGVHATVSPVLSPSSQYSLLPQSAYPPPRRSSHSLSPIVQRAQISPAPHRPSSSTSQFSNKFGLDALVHAASEERRRLSGGEADIIREQDGGSSSIPLSPAEHVSQHQSSHLHHNLYHHHAEPSRQSGRMQSSIDNSVYVQQRSASTSPMHELKTRPLVSSPRPPSSASLAQYSFSKEDMGHTRSSPSDRRAIVHSPYMSPPQWSSLPGQLHNHKRGDSTEVHNKVETESHRQRHEQLLHQERKDLSFHSRELDRHTLSPPSHNPPSRELFQTPAQLHDSLSRDSIPFSTGRKTMSISSMTEETPRSHARAPGTQESTTSPTYPDMSLMQANVNRKRRYSNVDVLTSHAPSSRKEESKERDKHRVPSGEQVLDRKVDVATTVATTVAPTQLPTDEVNQSQSRESFPLTLGRTDGGASFQEAMSGGSSARHDPGHRDRQHPETVRLPSGRRSPPGSAAGRAIAMRKVHHEGDMEVKRESSDAVMSLSFEERNAPRLHQQPVQASPPKQVEDPNDWFIQQLPPGGQPKISVPSQPVKQDHYSQPISPPKDLKPESVEEELESVIAQVETTNRRSPPEGDSEMDNNSEVDLAVTELVAETIGDKTSEVKDEVGMEVDVEDELLSLVGDKSAAGRHAVSSSLVGDDDAKHHRQAPALKLKSTDHHDSSLPPFVTSPSSTGAGGSPARPTTGSEAMSMPPPPAVDVSKGTTGKKTSASASAKEKKKAGPKSKLKTESVAASAKPRTKAGQKSKPSAPAKVAKADITSPPVTVTSSGRKSAPGAAAASRSRSTSVMPGGSVGPEDAKSEKPDEDEGADSAEPDEDKLYCVCKTRYEDDKCMIACDRCDEWYHTSCVGMSDVEVDLVDQFFCPPCVEKNPQLDLKTTYKQRCLYGLEHPDPSSRKACHKPARGVFSKYCSDACGVKNMRKRIDAWAKKGGQKDQLWDTVKTAEKREGVVYKVEELIGGNGIPQTQLIQVKPSKAKAEREVDRLQKLLDGVMQAREELKQGMEVILWRERLLELAMNRAENLPSCGWDQRLCFGDEEYAEYGDDVLDSYDNVRDMDVDGEGEWWCLGDSECERHAGWQSLRQAELESEKTVKEAALLNLTTKEREIRRRIEDIDDEITDRHSKGPLKSFNPKLTNGHSKGKSGDLKKGKKRKAPS